MYEIIYIVYTIIQGTCCCAHREATRVIESINIMFKALVGGPKGNNRCY